MVGLRVGVKKKKESCDMLNMGLQAWLAKACQASLTQGREKKKSGLGTQEQGLRFSRSLIRPSFSSVAFARRRQAGVKNERSCISAEASLGAPASGHSQWAFPVVELSGGFQWAVGERTQS